jgi:8-oxo-dGTP pyrophosphatase MutT (NUDIX family)
MSASEHAGRQPGIRRVREHQEFANQYVLVYDDEVVFPEGRLGRYLRVVESHGQEGIAVLANHASQFALVRIYRYPLGQWQWEIPRGMGMAGVDPETTAYRELTEELGEPPRRLQPMGIVAPSSGILCTRVHLFYAWYDKPVTQPLDIEEVSAVRWTSLQSLLEEIAAGLIIDSFTISAITAALAHRLIRL